MEQITIIYFTNDKTKKGPPSFIPGSSLWLHRLLGVGAAFVIII